jgi:hypothetical protein
MKIVFGILKILYIISRFCSLFQFLGTIKIAKFPETIYFLFSINYRKN